MCLIAWNWQPSSQTPLLLLANRDEYYARPALALHWWEDGQVLAGRDLQAGGTWLGLSRNGRMAALTNYRMAQPDDTPRPSRGSLVADFLQGHMDAPDYLHALRQQCHIYNPFNLLVFDGLRLMGLESRHRKVLTLPVGIGAVSNADFDTPWPKLDRLKAGLQQHCDAGRTGTTELLALLQDRSVAADADLPHTGVALPLERMLSACWIQSEFYGTRASSILAMGPQRTTFLEQGYGAQGPLGTAQQIFTASATP